MRPRSIVLTSIFSLAAACSGAEKPAADSSAAASSAPASAQASPAAADAPAAAPERMEVIPGSAAPITGTIIQVKMIGDAKGYRFEPQHITAKPGDGVSFVVVSGGPHELLFDLAAVPAESREQLQINMPNSSQGRSPLLAAENETWTLSLGGLKPGKYPFVSFPRLPQGMKGEIEIQ